MTALRASKDLPFAQARFSRHRGPAQRGHRLPRSACSFGEDYGVTMTDGPLQGLLARAVVVVDENGQAVHSQLVPEISQEPDDHAAVAALSSTGTSCPGTGRTEPAPS
ncbi:hypothetical protein QJS66_21820 [Kocuria rhizophila]|nr:hypothetical protein QJS66_21820 [Kocuria rhizophila]